MNGQQVQQKNNIGTTVFFDLGNNQAYQDVKMVFEEIIEGPPIEAARFSERLKRLIDNQRSKLSQGNSELLRNYDYFVQMSSYYGLPFFNDSKVIDLINQEVFNIALIGYDIRDQIRLFLSRHISFEDRNNLRKKLISAMEASEERVGSTSIIFNNDKQTASTIKSWLFYRNSILGQVAAAGTVEEVEFFTKDRSIALLSAEHKEALRKVFQLYRWLHNSSLSEAGFEDRYVIKDEGGLKILRDGSLVNTAEVDSIIQQLNINKPKTPSENDIKTQNVLAEGQVIKEVVFEDSLTVESELKEIKQFTPITQTPQAIKSDKPALVFNIEDEKEVDKHRIKAGKQPVLEYVIRAFVEEVIKSKNLIFRDEVNKRRFTQLMVSRLKDVRGALEITEALRRPVEDGGLGMPDEKADQVQGIIEAAKREYEEKKKNQQLEIPEPLDEALPPPEPIKVVPPKPSFDAEAARIWREQMLKEIQLQGQPMLSEADKLQSPIQPPKPQLTDVKAPPKVVGPLEELRSLTLVDFRRLGPTSLATLQKIKSKIDLLGENSIGRRVEAVRAWKSSAVYQQYLRLGRESIEQGKTIGAIVGNRQAQGDPVLTEEEFNAIADFNAKLRF